MKLCWTRPRARPWLLLGLILCACTPPIRLPSSTPSWSGKLSLQVLSEPMRHWSAHFALSGNALHGELDLSTPLGTTVAQLHWNEQGATLYAGSNTAQQFASVDQATHAITGAPIPLWAIFSWLEGQQAQPHPAGWSVDWTGYSLGRIRAIRTTPLPALQLHLVLER